MREHDVPDWYIWSCKKIKYMFPKAHAAAYVMMAWRVAYCKVSYPLAYYCAYFSIRANAFDYEKMAMGRDKLEYFIDDYKNVRNNYKFLRLKEFKESDYEAIGKSFSKSAKNNGMTVQTCFEERNLVEYGFIQADCLGKELAERLTGKTKFKKWKARSGGKCNCVEMADIGAYNTCKHFCKYCYANYDEKIVAQNNKLHDVNSSLLIGKLAEDDIIKRRKN